jgi:hypothetical protein
MKKLAVLALVATVVGAASASEFKVGSNITTSTTWTANNVYNLQKQIYVEPGATLTIEAGTLVQSDAGMGGSIAVCRGAKIYVNGTATAPVIMTSSLDDLKHWHEGCNEWGNLTVMGNALISASHFSGQPVVVNGRANSKTPDGLSQKQMEGLTAEFTGDMKQMYGGGNDDDCSGALHFLSLRYGGKVIGLGNELNGLSMGGIGRETEVDHIDVMNNVDNLIETWGGTVNYKYVSLWNSGDDSFDVDEGWRGKAQFGIAVQGYSTDAVQGSGTSDNVFEIDGAEDSDAQPVTTCAFYNWTCIGQPLSGDQGTAWRDNAHIQYHNMIFMDLGEQLVKNDNKDGDGANGYGYNGTLTWEQTWSTPATYTSPVNAGTFTPGAFNDPKIMYRAQDPNGKLAEIVDSVFYHNLFPAAYTEAIARGVMDPNNHNVMEPAVSPIKTLIRGPMVTKGGLKELPVTYVNPRAASLDTIFSVTSAPDDGFYTHAPYRGAFDPYNNWLVGWTAAWAYGMTD